MKESKKLRENLEKRAQVISAIRKFFDDNGYLEVETPILVAKPGMEPFLNPFKTAVKDPKGERFDGHLITSPEYAMKKLLVAGFPRIYQLVKCFRNGEDFGGLHNPEFTMLEWYRTGTGYEGIMDELERMVISAATTLELEVAGPFERITVAEAFRKHTKKDAFALAADESEFHKIFLNEIEPYLGKDRPTILYDYPAKMAALSKIKESDSRVAERFELYWKGLEIANAFTELTDVTEQRRRFEAEREERRKLGKPDHGLDEDFLAALEEGMPESGGIALGVDRLLMALLDEKDIRNVLAFPADTLFTRREK